MSETAQKADQPMSGNAEIDDQTRRDFLLWSTLAVGAAGTAMAVWPFIDQMNPAADTLALSSIEVDLSAIEVGQSITVTWRGKPVFIRRRTEAEITDAESVAIVDLPDPQNDADRVQKPEWLVMVGVCTHLGCIPLGQKSGDSKGEFGGWFCPCHGSHYDTSGRIRKGPAPVNLLVPGYEFLDDTTVKIG
ncbi:ubiquinol-cytochrome c reductase iron-sulfur subunit [Rhodospirillales bacterium]|jgi:ubiquinol-cytochrome c reductase iron-sulfur subunit|nr:ubiquinol-cytochrome c reductase iron-sulfur subunit [Rhodospirillales bacterium]